MAVNTLKVLFGTLYLAVLAWMSTGQLWPVGLEAHNWLFMAASGLLGFVVGDYFLFHAYALVGSRLGMLLMSASVPLTVVASWLLFGEALGAYAALGIALTLGGIALTVLSGGRARPAEAAAGRHSPAYRKGVVFGLLSALAMAGGTLFTKVGAAGVPAVAATQVRVFTAFVGFAAVAAVSGKLPELAAAGRDRRSLGLIAAGAVFGPFIGVGCLLYALQHAAAGVVSTITALTPVLIIPPSVLILKKRVTVGETAGACVAVGGVCLLFL
jgi:drug/metabolite transporter (DMT)-like permease